MTRGNGTSYSGPLVAGLVACLMQAHPTKSNQQIFDAILMSSDRFDSANTAYGYGIPDGLIADSLLASWPVSKLNDKKLADVKIYPNPARDVLKIQCEPNSSFVLRNNLGQVVKQGDLKNWLNFLAVSEYPSGNYTLEVHSEDQVIAKKLLIGF
jgi:hypothetical protein